MPFITQDDYRSKIKLELLNQIIEDEPDTLTDAEASALAVIENRLFQRYDMDTVLAQEGDDRNKAVLLWAVNLTLYYVHDRIDDDLVPDRVVKNYDDTVEELLKIYSGELSANLPILTEPDEDGDGEPEPVTRLRFGSNPPRDYSIN